MAKQDRKGSSYEKLLACSLEALGYECNTSSNKNYQQPTKGAEVLIPRTYIQPDLVLRATDKIEAVLYSTHWSNTRSSKYKFWRTWEEQAQQRVAIGDSFLAVNCLFEALPADAKPMICLSASELPVDKDRKDKPPIQLEGWDPGIGWALVESFDVNILFPKNYPPTDQANDFKEGAHDKTTTILLGKALACPPKAFFSSQWDAIRSLALRAPKLPQFTPSTKSRYRIGLLHVYLLCKLLNERADRVISVSSVVRTLVDVVAKEIELLKLSKRAPFDLFTPVELREVLEALAGVFVRKGKKPQGFCKLRRFDKLLFVTFNSDLKLCAADLKSHLTDEAFINVIERTFSGFDNAFGVGEAIDDLAYPKTVDSKVRFVTEQLVPLVKKPSELGAALWSLSQSTAHKRSRISNHTQNWHFEILLHLCGLNSAEDIQTRFKERFEATGHKLRPHAPYGGHAQSVAFMLQGRDLCELWSATTMKRSLTNERFREYAWRAAAECLSGAIVDRGAGHRFVAPEKAATLYMQNKSMRIISSDLNGFYILIDHYLGDICYFEFLGDVEQDEDAEAALCARICPSWQTDMVKRLWKSAPLETWVEGVSKNGEWLVKVQSSQDGNEGHKTKELSGRCRAMHLAWLSGKNPTERKDWSFAQRQMPKVALVLDGDWNRTQKKNLCEAGWDWVGDITHLGELRKLIQS